jgi:hypothetical protein
MFLIFVRISIIFLFFKCPPRISRWWVYVEASKESGNSKIEMEKISASSDRDVYETLLSICTNQRRSSRMQLY